MSWPFILPENKPLTIYNGSHFQKTMRIGVRSRGSITPTDLTGYKFRAVFREKYESEEAILELTTDDGGLPMVDAEDGRFSIVMTIAQTLLFEVPLEQVNITDIPYKDFVFDIEATPPGQESRVLLKGVARVYAEVARD